MTLIMVVDDDSSVRDSIVEMLTAMRLTALGCESGKSAIEALRHVAFHVVVADILMPDMDGYELLRAIGNSKRRPSVILISGGIPNSTFDTLSIGRRLGADGALLKPFTSEELLAQIRGVLRDKSASSSCMHDS